MKWLGLIDIYITAPLNQDRLFLNPTAEEVHAQNILSCLIAESTNDEEVKPLYNEIEEVIGYLIGTQDNITVRDITKSLDELGYTSESLTDTNKLRNFQQILKHYCKEGQIYSGHIIYSDQLSTVQVNPPTVFMLFGSRPILDGLYTASVVFDQVYYNNVKVMRMLPSTYDVLFALGNDAAIQFLGDELRKYNYSDNLGALRYLTGQFNDDFWTRTIYNNWLKSIRTLNPPLDRSNLPGFMQTAAWWQKSMNTQLASWAELRHDFILYAKQPYSDGGAACAFPKVFVEPVPELYRSLKSSLGKINTIINKVWKYLPDDYQYLDSYFSGSLKEWNIVLGKLDTIAQKELSRTELSKEDESFLKSAISIFDNCWGDILNGWYVRILNGDRIYLQPNFNDSYPPKYLTVDYHTSPTDADGNDVGWVAHAGTGLVDIAVVTTELPNGKKWAFAGPVSSYYEFTTEKFQRLTDDEWETSLASGKPNRPQFTNLYLAGKQGEEKSNKVSLFLNPTSAKEDKINQTTLGLENSPNPITNTTLISFTVPQIIAYNSVLLEIYDMSGNPVNTISYPTLSAGNYAVRWNCLDKGGNTLPNGTYIYKLTIANISESGKMIISK
jgi:hypothetical protein